MFIECPLVSISPMEEKEIKKGKQEVFDLILDKKYSEASGWFAKRDFSSVRIEETVSEVYGKLIKDERFLEAIDICDRFGLPFEMKTHAIHDFFTFLKSQKRYEEAYNWALDKKLSKNDLNSVAVAAFEHALEADSVEIALDYFEKYEITIELVIAQVRNKFNEFMESKKYIPALLLGHNFDLLRKRTLICGVLGYTQLLNNNETGKFLGLEKEYRVLIDREVRSIDEKPKRSFLMSFNRHIIKECISKGDLERLHVITESIGLFENLEQNDLLPMIQKQLMKAAAASHASILEEDRGPAAFEVADHFKLLGGSADPDIKVGAIKAAEESHNRMLSASNLSGALFLKDKYELFGKNALENSFETAHPFLVAFIEKALGSGEVGDAVKALMEYSMPEEITEEIVSRKIHSLLQAGQYAVVFEIMRNIKVEINDQEALSEVTKRFHEEYENGRMKIASDLAYFFRMKEGRVPKATYNYWEGLFEERRFTEAREYYRERKIKLKTVAPAVKEMYKRLVKEGNINSARQLRIEYRLNISIFLWIVEIFKQYFSKK